MKFVLAEKPSVAADIAAAFDGTAHKKRGYYETNGYIISWAIGHLLQLLEPDDYDPKYKKWNIDDLPIIPDNFQYKINAKTRDQMRVLMDLFKTNKFSEVIIATDAGREGELIARLILDKCKWRGKTSRFWTSEVLTPDVVKKVLQNPAPSEKYIRYYYEGLARQHADQVVGINFSRLITLLAKKQSSAGKPWSIGRVQTAVLAILADRENKIKLFVPVPYWIINARFNGLNAALSDSPSLKDVKPLKVIEKEKETFNLFKFAVRDDAEQVRSAVAAAGKGIVKDFSRTQKKESAPLLFSLTSLQQEANKIYGFTSKKTLDIAQVLYERHKVLSYPRTSCRHMPTTSFEKVLSLARIHGYDEDEKIIKSSKIFNDVESAKSDHYALIPFKRVGRQDLSEDEFKIFELVQRRFLAAISSPYIYDSINVVFDVDGYLFKASAAKMVAPGWHRYWPPGWKAENATISLPDIPVGSVVTIDKVDNVEKHTTAAPRFTEASILDFMENVWKYIEIADNLAEKLKKAQGIGTATSRDKIIETLKIREYISFNQRKAFVTSKGMALYNILSNLDSVVIHPDFIGEWEDNLSTIINNDGYAEFMGVTKKIVLSEIDKIKEANNLIKKEIQTMSEDGAKTTKSNGAIKCPSCHNDMDINIHGAFCKEDDINVFRKLSGLQLTDTHINSLLRGEKLNLKGFTSKKTGKKFDANVFYDMDEKRVKFDFSR